MPAEPNYDNLSAQIATAMGEHYSRWTTDHGDETIYAYIVYPTALISRVGISVLTEEGLRLTAAKYRTNHGYTETTEQLIDMLRWSVADTPHCDQYQESFDAVNSRLAKMIGYVDSLEIGDPKFNQHTDKLYKILIESLNEFRDSMLQHGNPLLYVDFGDMSDEHRLWFIKQCNDEKLVEWYTTTLSNAW